MREPFDFTPGKNLFPSVDFEDCMKKCGMADPVAKLCGKLNEPFKTLCKVLVGGGQETCKLYCETFQKGIGTK